MKAMAITLLITAVCVNANSQPRPTPGTQPIKHVFDRSDLVCECQVESIVIERDQHTGSIEANTLVQQHVIAKLRPIEIFKSNRAVTGSVTLEYFEQTQAISPRETRIKPNENGLFFLRSTTNENYDFSDKWLGMTWFGAFPKLSSGFGLDALQSVLAAIINQAEPRDWISALRLLQGFDDLSPETIAAVALGTKSKNYDIALTSWAVILKNHSPESLQAFEKYIENYRGGTEPSFALIGVEEGLAGFHDPKDLASLELLADSHILHIRRGAIRALRGMRNPSSAATLVKHLDDGDHYIQYQSVITLNEIFLKNGDYGPSMMLFDENPGKYTTLWKKWWAEEGHNLVPTDDRAHSPGGEPQSNRLHM